MEAVELGRDAGKGNLLGVQPLVAARDYISAAALQSRLDRYMREAHNAGWVSERTVVVFPEHVGTWLVACGAPEAVFRAGAITEAMRTLVLRSPLRFGAALLSGREADRAEAALFRIHAESMAQAYETVFSTLARDHGVTVVAGSIVLPGPSVVDGCLTVGRGPLYNTCSVYGPNGQADSRLIRKVYPVTAELRFVCPAPLESLPTFETPAGRLGVMICADSWYPAPYDVLRTACATMLAVPSFGVGCNVWDRAWAGYDGAPTPDDVDPADVGRLTEGEAWRKYALAGRISKSGALCGVNVFLRGDLWDAGGDSGVAIGVRDDEIVEAGRNGDALVNVWR